MKWRGAQGNRRFRIALQGLCMALVFCTPAAFAVNVEDAAPSFEINTIDGKRFSTEDVVGNAPLFLVFWATWCPVCKEEIPKLQDIYSTFRPRGMEVLAVNVGINDSEEKVLRYIKKYGLDYPVAFDNGSRITRSYGVLGTPTIVIVDRRGVVRYSGASVPDDLDDHFRDLME